MNALVYVLFGLLLGVIIGWLLRSLRQPPPFDHRVEDELREQLRLRNEELIQIREKSERAAGELATVQAQYTAEEKTLADLRRAHNDDVAASTLLQSEQLALKRRNGELDAEVIFLKERLAIERQQIEEIQKKFQATFEAVSNKQLVDNSSRFNAQSTESLDKLLAPLGKTLAEFRSSLDATRSETATHSALLKEQIGRIGAEAANLSKALKGDIKALGNWGENMLDQILEKSGLQQGVHYQRQLSAKDHEGTQRYLDVIIKLPEGRNLVIDSKVSLRAYEESVNATDETRRLEKLNAHVDAIRKHFRDLGIKRYQDLHDINAPDFVLMYVPIEAAFFAAVACEQGLFGEALEHNVVLITNSTLLATLRTVSHVWRLADQQKHVLEIADRGGKLYDKFVGFIEDMQDVGKGVDAARRAWETASNKLHTGPGNLVRQAEQLKILGARATKSLLPAMVEKATEQDDPGSRDENPILPSRQNPLHVLPEHPE